MKVEWTSELYCAWKELLRLVAVASDRNLKNYNPEEALMLFTDASLEHDCNASSEIQERSPLELPVKPPLFLSRRFKKGQVNWHVSQNELYLIIYAFKRVGWLMHGFIAVYTDNKNLKHLLMPTTETPQCRKTKTMGVTVATSRTVGTTYKRYRQLLCRPVN